MASGNDMKFHNATYSGFLSLLKWTTPVILIVTAFVVILIA